MAGDTCDVCRRPGVVGVAAVPAAPVSIAWCRECLERGCQPMFAVEVHVCPCDPEHPEHDESIEAGMAWAKARGLKPQDHLAAWFLDEETWYEGTIGGVVLHGYIRVGDLLDRLYEAAPA